MSKIDKLSAQRNGRPITSSLTSVEVLSRNDLEFNVADGHMGFEDATWMSQFNELLVEVEAESKKLTDREAESIYISQFTRLFGQTKAIGANYKVLPSASLSIDVLMALANRRQWRVQLIHPCFDNLYHYAAERDIPLTPLSETDLCRDGADAVDTRHGLVVLIDPNNPTGAFISQHAFREIARKCARARTTLALDCSFRAYHPQPYDHYAILQDEGVSYVVIEDTGKTLPTRERKTSLIVCSNDLKHDVNELCEIHVLGWCSPVILLCERLFARIEEVGLESALHAPILERRQQLRRALSGTFLRPAPEAMNSTLPVEWIEITDDRYSDEVLTAHLREEYGLGLLPGHHFFWQSTGTIDRFVRFTLLKDTSTFEVGAKLLRDAILNVGP